MWELLFPAVLNGILLGGVYALVALGLTLIYGVLHIVNFAHGTLLMIGMFMVWLLAAKMGIDPYLALPVVTLAMGALGWALYTGLIGPVSRGEDKMLLLATLGVSILFDNGMMVAFSGDTRSIETAHSFSTVDIGPALVPVTKLVSFGFAVVVAGALWAFIALTETGRAIRAVAKEADGARLMGIRPARMYAVAFAVGTACTGAAACLLLPSFYVNPGVGNVFILIAFTIVVLGGMGSFVGAAFGALLVGVIESLGGLFLGESLGPILVPLTFIAVLLFRPNGLFGRS